MNEKDARIRKIWIYLMKYGKKLGCHQKAERSFFIGQYQFPVCARCTGVIISSAVACFTYTKFHSFMLSLGLCACMLCDWLIQRLGIKESTNKRRLITGLMGGYGFMTIQLLLYEKILKALQVI